MKCGKLTAKLRDAVPVRFYENGKEIKRYKNIEIPDTIKELEFQNFKFDVPESGAITFKIFFAPGVLPETWPEARQRKARIKSNELIITTEDEHPSEIMEVRFDVTRNARKALAHAIAEQVGGYPTYQAAPSFAYTIGEYTLDRNGILTGPRNLSLFEYLTQDGYQTK